MLHTPPERIALSGVIMNLSRQLDTKIGRLECNSNQNQFFVSKISHYQSDGTRRRAFRYLGFASIATKEICLGKIEIVFKPLESYMAASNNLQDKLPRALTDVKSKQISVPATIRNLTKYTLKKISRG